MSSGFSFKREWELSMDQQLSRLGKNRSRIQSVTYDGFQASIALARDKHNSSTTTIALQKLQPVLDLLNIFVNAITSIVQASPELAGFIWGSMQAVVTLASRFTNLLSTISEMFHELASIVVQLNRYLALFPGSNELQQCTRCIINDYVGFSVSALIFFQRWPWYNLLRLFWSTVDKKYDATRAKIAQHYADFERTRQFSVDSTLVDSSRRILEILPTITILPAVPTGLFEVPLLRNPHFSERDDEVELVRHSLTRPNSTSTNHQSTCLLQGLGGVGKTSIALEYAFRFRDKYDFVFWIPAETALDVTNTAATISRKLKLSPKENTEQQPQLEVERLRTWLETLGKNWLLVLDNVEHLSIVAAVWPRAGRGHVLLTSQKSELAQVCLSNILVRPLDSLAGSRLLLKLLTITQPPSTSPPMPAPSSPPRDLSDEGRKAEMIAKELSGIPLAITFVAGIFSSMSLDEILGTLKNHSSFATIFAPNNPPTLAQYGKPLGATWDMAQKQLTPTSLRLAQTLAMLSPTGVTDDLIATGNRPSSLSTLGVRDAAQYHAIISNMRERHLIERQHSDKGAYLLMHRLVQRHILSQLEQEPKEFQRVFEGAWKLVRTVFPRQSPIQTPQNNLWGERELYSPHVLSLCVIFDNHRTSLLSVGIEFAEMLTDASSYFWERSLFIEGYQTIDAAEAICDGLGDDFASAKANSYAISAAIRQSHGISQRLKCRDKWSKALRMRQHYLHATGPESITDEDMTCWGNAWNDLGCILLDFGCYEESSTFLIFAWELRKASVLCQQQYNHFPESPMNVSMSWAGMGRYEEAIALMSETTQNTDKAVQRDSAVAQDAHFALASILVSSGRYDDAFSEAREVYERRTTIFGLSNRRTSDAAYLLATIEQKRGNLERAAAILETTLSILNGWTDEAEARARYRLGGILMQLGRGDDAARLHGLAEKSLFRLWGRFGDQTRKVRDLDPEVAFDLLASVTAGRSTLGRTPFSGTSGLGSLGKLCSRLLERLRGETDKSPSRLCELFNLEQDADWLLWSENV